MVPLTRDESKQMAIALSLGIYPRVGYPMAAVTRACRDSRPRGVVMDSKIIFYAPIREHRGIVDFSLL